MLNAISAALTSPRTGPWATLAAVLLALALAVAWHGWEGRRATLEARIVQLTREGERAQSLWRAELAACHAGAGSQRTTQAQYAGPTRSAEETRQMLEHEPEGIDACARMESADQAVLSNLK